MKEMCIENSKRISPIKQFVKGNTLNKMEKQADWKVCPSD